MRRESRRIATRSLCCAALLALCVGCGRGPAPSPDAAEGRSAPSQPASAESPAVAQLAAEFDPKRDPANDLQLAIAAAQGQGKRIILDVGGDWCGWCRRLDALVDKDAAIRAFRDSHFVWVKVNYSEENENKRFLSQFPQAKGYPHLFVLDSDGDLLHSQFTGVLEQGKGYDRDKLIAFLKKWAPSRS
ncbi:thioredoxin family protein [Luteimonas sp. SX5]|uniref:Thioredoxin family protein n=1 Tax=Luteimonas galliterrae TaxID=2940486 RepID=A0ABT0MII8_9GAMM|nr:thioredoxin family protein [Luteimonas galliterrae]MCL1634683.1 thioredoxin family protein [Luteimonas galliterrae]